MTSKTIKKLKDIFLEELVVFYLKEMKVAAYDEENEELKISGMVEGYVIDIDEDFYYLGNEEHDFEKVISHNVIAMVEIAQLDLTAIEGLNYPEDKGDLH